MYKSPLCEYDNINLCPQANVFGASFQEAKNHQKNKKRFRSACLQGFGVHFLYNFLMDFYDNKEIVMKHKKLFSQGGKEIRRDVYERFYNNRWRIHVRFPWILMHIFKIQKCFVKAVYITE